MKFTKKQLTKAYDISNDISEDIDNDNTIQELRTTISVYADLLDQKQIELNSTKDKLLSIHKKLLDLLDVELKS